MFESHLPTDYFRITDYLRLLRTIIHKERKSYRKSLRECLGKIKVINRKVINQIGNS